MLQIIHDFLDELPFVLIFGIAAAVATLIALFIPKLFSPAISYLFPQESSDEVPPLSSNSVTAGTSIGRASRRRRRRNPFKRLYSAVVAEKDDSSPSDDSSYTPPARKRRHSTGGPFHFARAAKNFIRGGSYYRQNSEAARGALPKPPTEFFVPNDQPGVPPSLTPEMFYMDANLNMLELPQEVSITQTDLEVRMFEKGDVIVKPGDLDNFAYVVLEGTLAVYISPSEGKQIMVKRIEAGQSFFSVLSLLDILMKMPSKFKTVSLEAMEDSKVAVYCFDKFHDSYKQHPELWTRTIQIILVRLLHVALTTLHQHLGLGEKLLKRKLDDKFDDRTRHVSGHSMRIHGKAPRSRQRRLSSSDAHMDVPRTGVRWSQASIDEASVYGGTHHGLQTRRKIMTIAEDQNELQSLAVRWFGEALNLNNTDAHALLNSRLMINSLDEGRVLNEQGSTDNAQLILVLQGSLKITQDSAFDDDEDSEESWLTLVQPREIVGALQLLTNEPCFYTISAATPSMVAVLSAKAFAEVVEERPHVYLPVAYSVLRRLSTFVRAVDFAIDWILLDSGQSAYRTGDIADSLYVVLSGRLRSVDKKVAIEEFGRGDALGIIEVLQRKPRSTTVLAVRYSQLARVPEGLLNFVKMQYPQVGFRLVRLLGQFYSDSRKAQMISSYVDNSSTTDPIAQVKNLRTIAILPASLDVPLTAFSYELYHVLNASGRVLRLSSKKIAEVLGESVLEKQADFRLMHWLNAQEESYPLIIYECDYTATNWTRRCLRQADTILVVGLGHVAPPKRQLIEDHLNMNQDGIRTTKKLILLWREDTAHPSDTFEWLKGSWFSGHYHVRAPDRMFQWNRKNDEMEVVNFYEDTIFPHNVDFNSDFSRLGRILTGNAVGLVLGGGGARGASHVGVIRAMREHGIPVDIVGGTSIGSMIGGIFAEDPHNDVMTSLWRKIVDLTYAHSAMFTGAGFNRTLQELFGTKSIEDMWLPYFCITTDISTSEMRVHRSGPLWAYARASMSLAGYLPPLCDPEDGHLLLDGGYVNNLPADVMRSLGARCVIAVDVGSASDTDLYNYGDSLSGFWVMMNRLNPWAKPMRILGMEEIQSRLAYVSCVRQLEMVKKAPYCHYLRPPIDVFQTLDFAKFDTICAVGYDYASEKLTELVQNDSSIKAVMNPDTLRSLTKQHGRRRQRAQSMRNSFTDLAAQISRIPGKARGSMTDVSVFDEDWHDDLSDVDSYDEMSEEDMVEEEDMVMNRMQTPRID
ncbi:hypothetical protein M3Y96_00938500 [Aphelenchoides besseyi]|nr:hypothetical protein M3Y96_00938500 [Aphelenchoides besseyi]